MTPETRSATSVETARPVILPADTPRVSDILMRSLDIVVAGVLLIALSPLLLVVALLVRLDSRGPAIFRQERIGRNLKPFKVAKFRTMRNGVPADPHRAHVEEMIREQDDANGTPRPMMKLQADPRITKIGGFLRRTSVDELPQLWNVLRGEMSLVGPRPPIQYEVDAYPARAFRRFAVRPGLTGLWQVRGRSLVTFSQMIDLDTEYVETRSLLLNLKILVLTVPTVLHGKGAE
ncbi:MAG TPA: sugar transferase [Solirubrobacterales bacterium]|nr:sugar transferase [Solirubrobacterales bacterium]